MVAITAEYRDCEPGEYVTVYCGHRCEGHSGTFLRVLQAHGRECVEIREKPGWPPMRFVGCSIIGVVREAQPATEP